MFFFHNIDTTLTKMILKVFYFHTPLWYVTSLTPPLFKNYLQGTLSLFTHTMCANLHHVHPVYQ